MTSLVNAAERCAVCHEEGGEMTRTMIAAAIVVAASAGMAAAQDTARGEHAFGVCRPCHAIGEAATTVVGPELNGLNGRHSGSVPGYPYSKANKNSGIVWNEANFKQYIKDPRAMISGTKMSFAGIKNEKKIDDLWAYISQFNADGSIKKK